MISLSRKRELARIAETYASTAQTAAMIGRTGQVSRSTVLVGDADVEIAGGVETAVDTSVTVDAHSEELADAGDIADEVVSTLPDMTEDAWEAETVGQIAADGADWAAEFATELETELDAAKADLENALTEAHNALAEAGQARSEAAQAVADAQSAVAQATDAIQKALDAADLAEGAAPTWSTVAPTASDAAGRPVGAIWYVRDGAGKVAQMWELQALGWVQRPFSEAAIPQLAIGSGTYGSLAGDRLVAKSITAAQIQALAITANELAASSVTAVKIAADSVVAAKIAAGAVTTDKLNALAVTADKLAAGSVSADKIAAGAIVAGKIAAGAIDGMTITGALFRTASSGRRMQWNSYGITAHDSSGAILTTLEPDSGGFRVTGGFMITTGEAQSALTIATSEGVLVQDQSGSGEYTDVRKGLVKVTSKDDQFGNFGGTVQMVATAGVGVQLWPADSARGGSGSLHVGPVNAGNPKGSIVLTAQSGNMVVSSSTADSRVVVSGPEVRISAGNSGIGVYGPLLEQSLPGPGKSGYSGALNITAAAGVWQDVPSMMPIQITNPTSKQMICRVDFGAIVSASAGYSMLAVACTGATVIGVQQESKPGDAATFSALHTPFSSTTTQLALTGAKTVYLNPGTTTFTLRSMRSATGTHVTNYPSLLVEPRRFLE